MFLRYVTPVSLTRAFERYQREGNLSGWPALIRNVATDTTAAFQELDAVMVYFTPSDEPPIMGETPQTSPPPMGDPPQTLGGQGPPARGDTPQNLGPPPGPSGDPPQRSESRATSPSLLDIEPRTEANVVEEVVEDVEEDVEDLPYDVEDEIESMTSDYYGSSNTESIVDFLLGNYSPSPPPMPPPDDPPLTLRMKGKE